MSEWVGGRLGLSSLFRGGRLVVDGVSVQRCDCVRMGGGRLRLSSLSAGPYGSTGGGSPPSSPQKPAASCDLSRTHACAHTHRRKRARAHTRTHAHTRTRTNARARAHTHTRLQPTKRSTAPVSPPHATPERRALRPGRDSTVTPPLPLPISPSPSAASPPLPPHRHRRRKGGWSAERRGGEEGTSRVRYLAAGRGVGVKEGGGARPRQAPRHPPWRSTVLLPGPTHTMHTHCTHTLLPG